MSAHLFRAYIIGVVNVDPKHLERIRRSPRLGKIISLDGGHPAESQVRKQLLTLNQKPEDFVRLGSTHYWVHKDVSESERLKLAPDYAKDPVGKT